jgi:hypothetical protein
MNAAGITNAGGSGIAPTSATISSAQGFVVKAIASGSTNFSNAQRIGTNNTFQRTKSDWQRIWIGVEMNGKYTNEALIGFIPDATNGKDLYDATKNSQHQYLSLYTLGQTNRYSIQGLPSLEADREIKLGVDAKSDGAFEFKINHLDNISEWFGIYLFDSQNNSLTDLRSKTYKTDLTKGRYENRFSLRFIDERITSLEDDLESIGANIFSAENTVNILFEDEASAKSNIAIYDLTGKVVIQQTHSTEKRVLFTLPNSGIFIVKIENSKGVATQKLFISK